MSYSLKDKRGIVGTQVLGAAVILAFISFIGVLLTPSEAPLADMRLEPLSGIIRKDESFKIRVAVSADIPVNVFKGEVRFDHTKLRVESIDYNTSIADLWAEKPWYENGAGTINFIGGTTKTGGFLGTGILMTINFVSTDYGPATLSMNGARVLAHDGLGSDVGIEKPIDALFTVEESVLAKATVASPAPRPASISVIEEAPKTDINNDGKQSIADVSIFLIGLMKDVPPPEYDLNRDGKVNIGDLSTLMSAK